MSARTAPPRDGSAAPADSTGRGQALTEHFERVCVLSLPAARARREQLRRHLQ